MTCVSLLVGTTIWLILGSIITTLLIHLNAAHSEYTARMTELNQYMKHRELPQVSWAIPVLVWQLLQACWASVKICLTHHCSSATPQDVLRGAPSSAQLPAGTTAHVFGCHITFE